MVATAYVPMMAGVPDVIIWIVLAVGWVIIQAIVKNARKTSSGSSGSTRSPEADLDNFLSDIAGRVKESAEPEAMPPSPPPQPSRSAAGPRMKPAPAAFAQPHVETPRPRQRREAAFEKPPVQRPAPSTQPQPRMAQPPFVLPQPEPARAYVKEMILPASPRLAGTKVARTPARLKLLTSPDDWRQAIVYREIMGPPKALRGLEMTTPGRGE